MIWRFSKSHTMWIRRLNFRNSSKYSITGWWFQPIWKILVKLDIIPPGRGENQKNIWNRHKNQLNVGKYTIHGSYGYSLSASSQQKKMRLIGYVAAKWRTHLVTPWTWRVSRRVWKFALNVHPQQKTPAKTGEMFVWPWKLLRSLF